MGQAWDRSKKTEHRSGRQLEAEGNNIKNYEKLVMFFETACYK